MESPGHSEQYFRKKLQHNMEQLAIVEQRLITEETNHIFMHQQQCSQIIKLQNELLDQKKWSAHQLQEVQAQFENSKREVILLQQELEELKKEVQNLRTVGTVNMEGKLVSQGCHLSTNGSGMTETIRLPSAPVQEPIPSTILSYKKLPAADMAGELFEVKLAALLFLRGVNYMEEFLLASNFEAALSFDDIMFRFKLLNDESWKCYLIQLKHKQAKLYGTQSTTNFTISLSNLLSTADKARGNFSLVKYLNSFNCIKAKYDENDEDLLYCGNWNDITCVLYSNAPMDKGLVYRKKEISLHENILSTSSQGIVIRFDEVVDKNILTYLQAVAHFKDLLDDTIIDAKNNSWQISELFSNRIKDFNLPLSLNTDLSRKIVLLKRNVNADAVKTLLEELSKVNIVTNSDQYECFFNSFLLYANQAHEGELDYLIKEEIKVACFVQDPKVIDLLYKDIRDSIQDWWKCENTFLTKDALFWKKVILGRIGSISKLKVQTLQQQFLHINICVIEKIKQLIPSNGILNVISDSSLFLTSTKMYLALTSFEELTFIFVSLESLLEQQDEIISAWQSRWCNTLMVECTTPVDLQYDKLWSQLCRGVEVENKTLVLITSRCDTNAFVNILKSNSTNYDEFKDTCQWSDLDVSTQLHLLKRDLIFQGHKIPLTQLLNSSVHTAKVLCNDELAQFLERDLHIGPLLTKPIQNYIPRQLRCPTGELIQIGNTADITDRLILVVAQPGMGKSTLLTFLAYATKASDPSKWVLRINLAECISNLKELRSNTLNTTKAVEFLVKCGKVTNSHLATCCLEHSLHNTGRVVVFIDGVDEVCPDYKKEVCQLLACLVNTKIEKLWITSRPIIKEVLEEKLCVSSFILEPFTIDDQITFLKSFWNSKHPDIDNELLMKFINDILICVSKTISEDNPITCIPQLTSMIAEFYEKDLINVVKSNCLPLLNTKIMNKVQLYEHFIEAKYIYYAIDKKNQSVDNISARIDGETLKNTFLENHMLAALYFLFSPSNLHDLNIQTCEIDMFLNKIRNGGEKTGLIDKLVDGKPHFIHQTFSEYFASKWFSENFNSCRNFLKPMLVEREFEIIKENFDHILAIDKDLHTAILHHNLKLIDELLILEPDVNVLDRGGRTPLHLAVALNSHNRQAVKVAIVEKLLNMGASLDIVDDVLQWRPLQYADHICDWEIAKMLLRKGGKEEDMTEMKNKLHPLVFHELVQFFQNESAEPVDVMLVAAEHGDLQVLQFVVVEGVDVNMSNREGICALHKAAEGGHLSVIYYLAELGASFTIVDNNKNSALHFAAVASDVNVIGYLIDKIGTAEIENADLMTPLHVAVKNDNERVFKYLLDKGVHINAKSIDGWTPLLYASSCARLDTVKYLIESGASVNECNNENWYPLHFIAKENDEDTLRYLILHGAEVNACSNDGSTALTFAAEKSNLSAVKYLVEQGSEVNVVNTDGWTPLLHMAKSSNSEGIKYLICHGASVNACNSEGWTPLLYVAQCSFLPLVKYLVENGASVNCCNREGITPLLFAFIAFQVDTVKYLLDKKASVNVVSKNGMTPLYYASQMKNADLIERLLSLGSSVNCKLENHPTPLHFATDLGADKLHIVKTLVERGSSVNASYLYGSPLHSACNVGNIPAIKYLLSQGASVNDVDNRGCTPLLTLNNMRLDAVKCLIEHGSSLNVCNNIGETPLHHFSRYDVSLDIVKCLVDSGSCIDAVDHRGNTPLLNAFEFFDLAEKSICIIKYLVEAGADIHIVNKKGWSPLLFAGHIGCEELLEYMFERDLEFSHLTMGIKDWNNQETGAALVCAAFKGDSQTIMKIICNKLENVPYLHIVYAFNSDPLYFASLQGHLDVVKLLCEKNIYKSRENALYAAIDNNHLNVIEYFLMKNDTEFESGDSPLHVAVENGSLNVVLMLLKYNIDVNILNENGDTALHTAANLGYSDIVNCLLHHEAQLIPGCNGRSPLAYAALEGHIACAQLLIENGADVEAQASDGWTALHFASSTGRIEILELLLQHKADVNKCDNEGSIPLHVAAEEGRLSAMKILIEHGSNVNSANEEESTPLHVAATSGSRDMVEYLLNQGAQILCDDEARTPLHYAAEFDKLDVVKVLVEYGADVNAQDSNGSTPLLLACEDGTVNVVQYLIEHGANVEIRDSDGDTLLHVAVAHYNFNVIKYLTKDKGYEPVQNNDCKTALDIAEERSYNKCIDILLNSKKDETD